jgi:hypothetical protein
MLFFHIQLLTAFLISVFCSLLKNQTFLSGALHHVILVGSSTARFKMFLQYLKYPLIALILLLQEEVDNQTFLSLAINK